MGEGESLCKLEKETGVARQDLRIWQAAYKLKGEAGLEPTSSARRINGDVRVRIVTEYEKKALSYGEICAKYNISLKSLRTWVRMAREKGIEALRTSYNYRYTDVMGRKRKVPLEGIEKELEDAKKELQYLRMENAILKKLKALVMEKEARQKENRRLSSKD